MLNDPTKIVLSTRRNLQKIYLNDSITLSIALSFSPVEYTLVTHNLGYVPTVRVFYVPVSGQLWPLSPSQYSKANGGTGTILPIYGSPVVTDTELKVRVVRPGIAINVQFYYRIYIDE